jgi:hypothetical protein
MITTYQKIVNRMKMASLGLKHHQLDNKALATRSASKQME